MSPQLLTNQILLVVLVSVLVTGRCLAVPVSVLLSRPQSQWSPVVSAAGLPPLLAWDPRTPSTGTPYIRPNYRTRSVLTILSATNSPTHTLPLKIFRNSQDRKSTRLNSSH